MGFLLPGVDNAAHIGGLVGGILTTMAIGVNEKTPKIEKINGLIVLILYFAFMIFVLYLS